MIDTIFAILMPVAMAWILIYTVSYGISAFKDKNPLGGVMILVVAAAALAGCAAMYTVQ